MKDNVIPFQLFFFFLQPLFSSETEFGSLLWQTGSRQTTETVILHFRRSFVFVCVCVCVQAGWGPDKLSTI